MKPPKKNAIQIKESQVRPGHYWVKCLHGSEPAHPLAFALYLWHVSHFHSVLSTTPCKEPTCIASSIVSTGV